MKKHTHKPGEHLSLEIQKSKSGPLPIARSNQKVVCLIETSANQTKFIIPPINSVWDCKIVKAFDTYLVVRPIEMVVTPQANAYMAEQKLKKLLTTHAPKHEKVKFKGTFIGTNEPAFYKK